MRLFVVVVIVFTNVMTERERAQALEECIFVWLYRQRDTHEILLILRLLLLFIRLCCRSYRFLQYDFMYELCVTQIRIFFLYLNNDFFRYRMHSNLNSLMRTLQRLHTIFCCCCC